MVCAFVHSKCRGSVWYLCGVYYVGAGSTTCLNWDALRFFCTCQSPIAPCQHTVALLLVLCLFLDGSVMRPKWSLGISSIPSLKNTSQHLLRKDPFELVRVKETKKFLQRLVRDEPKDRNFSALSQFFNIKKKTKKRKRDASVESSPYQTTSFKRACAAHVEFAKYIWNSVLDRDTSSLPTTCTSTTSSSDTAEDCSPTSTLPTTFPCTTPSPLSTSGSDC